MDKVWIHWVVHLKYFTTLKNVSNGDQDVAEIPLLLTSTCYLSVVPSLSTIHLPFLVAVLILVVFDD